MQAGARVQTLKQLFNLRQGSRLRHEINPRAVGQPPLIHGANRWQSLNMDLMVSKYWAASGWDAETGKPGEAAVRSLEID